MKIVVHFIFCEAAVTLAPVRCGEFIFQLKTADDQLGNVFVLGDGHFSQIVRHPSP
jgi:hypothetical protein